MLIFGLRGNIEPPTGAVLAPAVTMLALAALGGGVTRFQAPEQQPRPQQFSLRNVAIAAISCTAMTVVLAQTYASQQDPSCSGDHVPAPAWAGVVGWAAVITAIAAFVLGLAGLAARRWFVALICVVVNPAALLYMVLSTGALC
jgi:hypothetical protein